MPSDILACEGCGAPIDCVDTDPLDVYGLQGPTFGFVLECPPGQNCANATTITFQCCGQFIVATFPLGATTTEKQAIIAEAVRKCAIANLFCGGGITVEPPDSPIPPTIDQFFLNREKRIDLACPGGGAFHYFIPAGTFAEKTQALADQEAEIAAIAVGVRDKFCVEAPGMCPCVGATTSLSLRIDGGNPPFFAAATSGHMPNGYTVSTSGRKVFLNGTGIVPGKYAFNLNVRTSNGAYWLGPESMNLLMIGYGLAVTTGFTVPAVSSTVVTTLASTGPIVGDVLRIGNVVNGVTTAEYGTFEVTALDSPSPGDVTIKNLTSTPGATVGTTTFAYWALGSLPDFQQGVAYSFSLPVVGGTGSYAWKIVSGSLPDGLTMTIGGVISGTPTGTTNATFAVEVIDLGCQSVDRTFYRPTTKLVGHSTRYLAVTRGFDEFIASVPPKRYMTRTWVGAVGGNDASGLPAQTSEALSVYLYASTSGQLASAHVIFSGFDAIDGHGNVTSTATVQMFSSCPGPNNVLPKLISNAAPPYGGSYFMPGWCFQYDLHESFANLPSPTYPKCVSCNFPLLPDNSFGSPTDLYHGHPNVTSSVHYENFTDGDDSLGFFNPDPTFMPFPPNLGKPLLSGQTARVAYKHAYTVDLTNEYTDAIALANATVTSSNGLTAVNHPRGNGYLAEFVTVTYDINCANLVFGESYTVTIDLVTSAFVTSTVSTTFTATGPTHTITAAIPTPEAGQTITAQNVQIGFTTP